MRKALLLAVFITALGRLCAQMVWSREDDTTIAPFYQVMDSIFTNVDLSRLETGYLAQKSFQINKKKTF